MASDLSRLRWKDVPDIAKDRIETEHGHYERILKGGLSQPSWGDEGPVFTMQYCHFVIEGRPLQIQSFSIPVALLKGLHEATGQVLAKLEDA